LRYWGRGEEQGEEKNGKKMERDEKEKIGVANRKWSNKGLSKLVLGQNAEMS
jgi:hypothetical protein